MSSFTDQAAEAAETYLAAVAKVQDASMEAVTTLVSKLPDAARTVPAPVVADLPTTAEVTAAYFSFAEKLVANQKAYTERFLAAVTPAA